MQCQKSVSRSCIGRALVLLALVAGCAAAANPASAGRVVLYSFAGAPDGQEPMAAPIADRNNNLFGVTSVGGSGGCSSVDGSGCGTVFELSPDGRDWAEAVLYSFKGGRDGQYPQNALVFDANGNLYGTTSQGGTGNCINMGLTGCGTVFELSPQGNGQWAETVLYQFQGVPGGNGNGDAAEPNSLAFDSRGNLFGFASNGGSCTAEGKLAFCDGAAFELRRKNGAWRETVIFRADSSAGLPSGVLFDAQGNIYSTAIFGGPENLGAIFKLAPPRGRGAWMASHVYDFQNQNDGALPMPGLVFDAAGNLYGASDGSDSVAGNIFELTPGANGTWTESVLVSFNSRSSGNYPAQGPIRGRHGNLFGTTPLGGNAGGGVAYRVSRKNGAWREKELHQFAGGSDGLEPYGGVVLHRGTLYGTTMFGGTGGCRSGCGTVFGVAP